jgi:tetratricopeptide (TPR) repeat protein
LVGLIWLFFVGTITFLATKNLLSKSHSLSQTDFIIVVIWFSYVVQSSISVDHLALTLLGIISAALITKNNLNSWVKLNSRKVSKTNNFSQFTLISVFFLSCAIFLGQVIKFEFWARDITDRKNPKNLEKIYTSRIIVPQTLEDIAVEVSKTKNFEMANRFAEKLLTHRPSSHQGYYIKSVFFESKSDLELAKTNMLKALDLDPYNSVYLLSMAIFEYKLSNLDIAKDYFLKAQKINPNQEGLDLVSQYITY